jgi:hypothetical protein
MLGVNLTRAVLFDRTRTVPGRMAGERAFPRLRRPGQRRRRRPASPEVRAAEPKIAHVPPALRMAVGPGVTSGLGNDASGFVSWAMWAVDALHYLDDLDEHGERVRWIRAGHHEDTIDLVHARWAASTAMTALDLSAAAAPGTRPDHDLEVAASQVCDERRAGAPAVTSPGHCP